MIKYLLSKSSNDKFRFVIVESDEQWHDKGYVIQRSYGQVNGKIVKSPEIVVDRTKQKRTWKEQLLLQFNSEVKKFLDKGYIEVEKHPNDYTDNELNNLFGEIKTNRYGIIKPMLAKQESAVTNRNIFNKDWMISRKLDGVRCLLVWDGKVINSYSRGGETYDYSTVHIRENEKLIQFFKNHPSIILDGELYRHGKTLQQISGAARMEKNASDCDWLEYWIFDMYDQSNPDISSIHRYEFLQKELPFPLYPYDLEQIKTNICLLKQDIVNTEDCIWNMHDIYVSEGFEGCVIRDKDKPYKPAGRTNDMVKFKNYKSEDFLVVGYELGLRGSEDMCFICQLNDGRTFKAMPVGDRVIKSEYVENFDSKYKNHKGECTFFNYSDDGIPTQPKFRIFRFDLE